MKKPIFIILGITLGVFTAKSQQVVTFSMDGSGRAVNSGISGIVTEHKEIGNADLECVYSYRFLKDTIDASATPREEVMILQIGEGMSRFYSYQTMKTDSLLATVSSIDEVMSDISRFRPGPSMNVFKNYPAGKITFTEKIGSNYYLYEENTDLQQWHLHDYTKEIEGYECRMATCHFRGRNYTAWFTPEIPLSEGPWKFSGLPGLIMEVTDDAGHYSYLLTGMRQVENSPIKMAEVNYHKIDRKKFLQTKEKFEIDPIGSMGMTGVTIRVMNPDGTPNTEATKPKDMKYAFEERDYK